MVQEGFRGLPCGGLLGKLALILLLSTSFGELVDRVVANVNGEPILESELRIAEFFYPSESRDRLIQRLVENHLLAQFLRSKGVSVPDTYLDKVLRDIARASGKTLEELSEDLLRIGLTLEDLKNFLRTEIASTVAFREYMKRRIRVSELEVELDRLRRGEVEYMREIELIVVDKGRKEELLRAISEAGVDLKELGRRLGLRTERLRIKKGELVEPLDEEVWKARVGQTVVSEDEKNLYLAKVLRELRLYSGRSEEEIREEILMRKIERERRRVLSELREESLVEILPPLEPVLPPHP